MIWKVLKEVLYKYKRYANFTSIRKYHRVFFIGFNIDKITFIQGKKYMNVICWYAFFFYVTSYELIYKYT